MLLAEGEGFEPPVGPRPTAVFKTAAFNRSANPPRYGRKPYYAAKPGACQGFSQPDKKRSTKASMAGTTAWWRSGKRTR